MRIDFSRLGAAAVAVAALVGITGCGGTTKASLQSASAPHPSYADVSGPLMRLEQQHHARVGAYAVDTGTGRAVGYRSGERFPELSTFKSMASAAVLRKARTADPGLMKRVIHYTRDDLVEHSPITGKHVGTGMTVAALCRAAITASDNTAGNLLLRQIGGPRGMTAYYRSLGDPASRIDRWETDLNIWKPGDVRDTTVPSAYARDLRRVTLGNGLARADRTRLLGWMKANTTGDARIRAGLPKGWTVADKTGTGATYGAANDIAVARPPHGAPVVMVILTNGRAPDGEGDEKAIAEAAAVLARGLGHAG